jgi:hypothetical protein
MANNLLQLLKDLEQKVTKIKMRADKLALENAALQNTVFEHLQNLDNANKKIKTLQQEGGSKQLADMQADKLATKELLDKYVRLIDKTIAEIQVNE